MGVTKCDISVEAIIKLHDTDGLSFREIAHMEEYRPIPAGTICTIYHTKVVPKKWHKMFHMPVFKPAKVCDVCGEVHISHHCPTVRKMPKRWSEWSTEDLRKAIEGREEW